MDYKPTTTQNVLVVEDDELLRFMLCEILSDNFNVLEATNGQQAMEIINQHANDLSVVLLDIFMPMAEGERESKDAGLMVLEKMNKLGYTEHIPVIMASAETDSSTVEKAYNLGASDFIGKPYEPYIVLKRVINNILLFNKQQSLMQLVVEQVYEQQRTSSKMIGILSHIVETKNGESGLHTLHISTMTRILLNCLIRKTDKYPLTQKDIDLISTASSLHDIGKMNIPDEILNKPGRFTDEEYAIMKTHSMKGAEMLKQLDDCTDDALMKYAYEICRWHHERWDGRGYPDGLKGDQIPIWAQIVSIADVYDALTAERVYKKSFDADTAIRMISNGECGAFNSILMECLVECRETIKRELNVKEQSHEETIRAIANEVLQEHPVGLSQKTFNMYHLEKVKNEFYRNISDGIHFDYSLESKELLIRGNARLGYADKVFRNPMQNETVIKYAGVDSLKRFIALAHKATPAAPDFENTYDLQKDGQNTSFKVDCRVIFEENSDKRVGVIGKITKIG